jgi:hypothetical protein
MNYCSLVVIVGLFYISYNAHFKPTIFNTKIAMNREKKLK